MIDLNHAMCIQNVLTASIRRALPALALALLAACNKPSGALPGPPQGPPAVSVAAALEKEIVETDEFPGRIEAIDQVEVRARVTGYIQSVNFKPGAEVKKGDLLFQIDPRPFEAAVAQAQATLGNARAQLDLARTVFARQEALLAERATSKREYDEAAAAVRSLEAQVRANQAVLDTARLNLSYTRVTAPVSGRVGKAEITPGNLVQGEAFLKYIGKSRGDALPVAVGLADESGFPHRGRLEFIDNRVDPDSGTVRMRAVLGNKSGRFTPGLFARVQLGDAAEPRAAVLVVDRAIGTDQSKRFVLVVNGENKTEYREVKIGRLVDGLRVIESGLKPGELIVVNGLQRARPGAPITPENVPMEASSGNGRPGAPGKAAAS